VDAIIKVQDKVAESKDNGFYDERLENILVKLYAPQTPTDFESEGDGKTEGLPNYVFLHENEVRRMMHPLLDGADSALLYIGRRRLYGETGVPRRKEG
jgi:hypothetical protein